MLVSAKSTGNGVTDCGNSMSSVAFATCDCSTPDKLCSSILGASDYAAGGGGIAFNIRLERSGITAIRFSSFTLNCPSNPGLGTLIAVSITAFGNALVNDGTPTFSVNDVRWTDW